MKSSPSEFVFFLRCCYVAIVGSSPCGVPGPEIISITVPDIAGCREWETANPISPEDAALERKRELVNQLRKHGKRKRMFCRHGSDCQIGCVPGHLLCHHFVKHGNCSFGANCKFEHDRQKVTATTNRTQRRCYNFQLYGHCRFEDTCKFVHTMEN